MIQYSGWDSPMGSLVIGYNDSGIVSLRLSSTKIPTEHTVPIVDDLIHQLNAYFSGSSEEFDIPVNPSGTPFQKLVWHTLREIPYGQTRTYGEIAEAIGLPGAARAVGMACNKNPIWLLIPCHRVIGSNGKLTGYAGGLDMKRALLELEQQNR